MEGSGEAEHDEGHDGARAHEGERGGVSLGGCRAHEHDDGRDQGDLH